MKKFDESMIQSVPGNSSPIWSLKEKHGNPGFVWLRLPNLSMFACRLMADNVIPWAGGESRLDFRMILKAVEGSIKISSIFIDMSKGKIRFDFREVDSGGRE
jgi:hypothetical protein